MTLGARLKDAMQYSTVFSFTVAGHQIGITETIVVMWVCMAILIAVAIFMRCRLETVPKGRQVWSEWAVDFCDKICGQYCGKYGRYFSPYIFTLFLFIFLMNLIPVLSPVGITLFGHAFKIPFDIKPPTRDISVTSALAGVSIIMVIVAGIINRGPIHWLGDFLHPMPVMLPFNILDYITKPLSLALRLFGNMMGAFIIMTMIETVIPLVVPIPVSAFFDWFDGGLQALVFSFLTIIYLNMSMGIEATA
jgi:F-type H+-transporting ATPase subunit a